MRSLLRREGKEQLLWYVKYALIVAALALPQLLCFTFRQAGSFLRFNWNWDNVSDSFLWFYIKNWGLLFLLLPVAFLDASRRERAVFAGALAVWAVAELVQFQPNPYDNNKLLFVSFAYTCALVAKWLVRAWRRLRDGLRAEKRTLAGARLLAGMTAAALFLSGTLTLAREWVSEYQLIGAEEVEAAEFIRENTESDATFLTYNNHNNAVAALTGRNIVCGSGTFLYFHGVDYSAREQALRGLMIPSGNDAAIVLAEYVGKKIDPKTKDAEATFVKAMNERAKKLGCTGTLFENPHGLDFDEWAGDMHSTAHDVALMMQEAMKNDTIREVVASEDSWIEVTGADGTDHSHSMDTHNYLLGQDGNIGGKTGTSTKTTKEISGEKEYIVSFIGFAPADDPQIAILVLLDDPSSESGIYISGGQMAAPVVGKMMADILPYLGVEPEYSDSELAAADRTVPEVSGMSLTEVRSALTEAGLNCRVIGEGDTVTDQLPRAGAVIASGSEVLLYAGQSPSPAEETMPDLRGLSYEAAKQALGSLGLYVTAGNGVTDAQIQLVSGQSIAPGQSVEHGTVIEVTLYENEASMLGIY